MFRLALVQMAPLIRLTKAEAISCPRTCHPDRSEAKWRDLLFSFNPLTGRSMEALPSPLSSRPERSAVEGSAVQRTSPGNVFRQTGFSR